MHNGNTIDNTIMYQVKVVSRSDSIAATKGRKAPGQVLDEHLAAGWEPIGCTTTLTTSPHGGYEVNEWWALRRPLPGLGLGVVVRLGADAFGGNVPPFEVVDGTVPVRFGELLGVRAVACQFGVAAEGVITARIRSLYPGAWPGSLRWLRAVVEAGVLVRLECAPTSSPSTCQAGCAHWCGPGNGCARVPDPVVAPWLAAYRTGDDGDYTLGVSRGAPPCPGFEWAGDSDGS